MNHMFSIEIAQEYGMLEAVLLEYFNYWIAKNEANEKHFHDGRYWTYNSVKAFQELFPYATAHQLRRAMRHLEDEDLIMTARYNEQPFDQTLWYALTDKGLSIFPKAQIDLSKSANAFAPERKPIPVNKHTVIDGGGCIISDIDNNNNRNVDKDYHSPDTIVMGDTYGDGDMDVTLEELKRESDPVVVYATSNLQFMTPNNLQELVSFRDSLPDDVIIFAIDCAVGNGVRKYAYVRAILNKFIDAGIKTLGDAKALDESRKKNDSPQSNPEDDEYFKILGWRD